MAVVNQGRMKARQGRIAEAEYDARRALLSRLKATGKYNARTTRYIGYLASILMQQSRLTEAEQLIRAQIEINRTLGIAKDSGNVANALSQLASNLNLQGRWKEAAKVYSELDEAIANWPPARKEGMSFNENKISTMYATNNLSAGIAAAERLVERQKSRYGEQRLQTASARGMLAVGLARAGRDADAMNQFKLAVPILATASLETDLDDTSGAVAPYQRTMTAVVEAYIGLLARSNAPDAAVESFRLADLIRGRSVQNALVASSVRAVAGNPVLSELARKNQDLDKQVSALLGALNNSLALPPEERDATALQTLRSDIDKLRAQRDASKRDLARRFPQYASLIEPQTPGVDEIRAVLREDEAFLSFYFGRRRGFVWAVPKTGPVAFASLRLHAGDIETKVAHLRKAFEPEGEELADIPPFDVAGAYELFAGLLKPVEIGLAPCQEPDRGDQRRTRLPAACPVADRAQPGHQPCRSGAVWRLSPCGVAGAQPCRDLRAVRRVAAHLASTAVGIGQTRDDDRLRRPLLQQGAGRRSAEPGGHAGHFGELARHSGSPARGGAKGWRGPGRVGAAAAARRHGRGAQGGGADTICRSGESSASRQRRQ